MEFGPDMSDPWTAVLRDGDFLTVCKIPSPAPTVQYFTSEKVLYRAVAVSTAHRTLLYEREM